MSMPTKNVWFERLPANPNIRIKKLKTNEVYIFTDENGEEAVVGMDGRKQTQQQQALNRWAEQTISRKLYEKGYRYRMVAQNTDMAPLHAKTLEQVARVMREDFPTKRFDVKVIDENGNVKHCSVRR